MFPGFEHPFTCVMAGPSKCGKTVFLQKLLKGPHLYIYPPPERIIWCFGIKNDRQIKKLESGSQIPIEFVEGLPDLSTLSAESNNLLILDDLMQLAGNNSSVASLFTKGSHHMNASVIFVLQNVFHQAHCMRDIHTSSDYLILFKNPRDSRQISALASQCNPSNSKYLIASYNDACCRPFGYLILDFRQSAVNENRYMTGIFPPEVFFYYRPINSSSKGMR